MYYLKETLKNIDKFFLFLKVYGNKYILSFTTQRHQQAVVSDKSETISFHEVLSWPSTKANGVKIQTLALGIVLQWWNPFSWWLNLRTLDSRYYEWGGKTMRLYFQGHNLYTQLCILEWNVLLLLRLKWLTVMMSNYAISFSFAWLRDDLSIDYYKYHNLASRKEYLLT